MRIIGIDPGTGILGFGVIEVTGRTYRLITAGVIRTPAHTPLDTRLEEIFDGLTDIIAESKPEVMSIEKLFFARNVNTAMSVAHARGVAMLAGRKAHLEFAEYTPMQIKQTLTGYGKADKKQVQEMVRLQLKLKDIPRPDDAADALGAAITHALIGRVGISTDDRHTLSKNMR
ncbi:MAG TPA: crossover junction endodeoxyribonuclease RuvC [Candidatus Saccharimonadaceae bacterium]|nr:crossover junction endodeoxyribonuclease RuvC [Candidatus Saccharimonadaceae bacterium]